MNFESSFGHETSPSSMKKKDHYNLRFDSLDKTTHFIIWIRMKNMPPFGQDYMPLDIFKIIVDLAKSEPGVVFDGVLHLQLSECCELEISENGELLGDFEVEQEGSTLKFKTDLGSCSSTIFSSGNRVNFFGGNYFTGDYCNGIMINGNQVTINGVTYTLPPYNSMSVMDNTIILDGKVWNPEDTVYSTLKKQKVDEYERLPEEPTKKYFLSPSTTIKYISVGDSCKVKKVPEKFIAYDFLEVSGAGSINVDSCSINTLRIEVSDTGKIKFDGCLIEDLTLSVSGAGKVSGMDTTVNELGVDTSGTSKVSGFFVCQSIRASASGVSKIKISKSSDCQVNEKSTSELSKIKFS